MNVRKIRPTSVGYILGGIVCDAIGTKLASLIGYLGNIIVLVLMMTLDLTYQTAFALNICFGLSGGIFVSSARLKYCSVFGPKEMEGRALGWMYTFVGITQLLLGNLIAVVVAKVTPMAGFRFILMVAVVGFALAWINSLVNNHTPLIKKKVPGEETEGFNAKAYFEVIKNPMIWILILISGITHSSQICATYIQPLLADHFGCSTSTITLISTWTNDAVLLVVSAIAGGLIDKFGAASKVVTGSLFCMLLGLVITLVCPWKPAFVIAIVAALALVRTVNGICKPGRQAMISECAIPDHSRGVAVGLVFAGTAIPGIVLNPIFGNILTAYNSSIAGYRIILLVFLGLVIAGILLMVLFMHRAKQLGKG